MIGMGGKIISWTIVRVPPAYFAAQAPYPVALVELESGVRICAQVVDYGEDQLRIGQHVVTTLRKTIESAPEGVIPYGIKVKPI